MIGFIIYIVLAFIAAVYADLVFSTDNMDVKDKSGLVAFSALFSGISIIILTFIWLVPFTAKAITAKWRKHVDSKLQN